MGREERRERGEEGEERGGKRREEGRGGYINKISNKN
jgi:hypothetical protein